MRYALAAIMCAICSACGSGESSYEEATSESFPSDVSVRNEGLGAGDFDASPEPAPLPQPLHNYDQREGPIYSYIAAISEDDQKAGKAAGDVISFAYLGKRGAKHVLARVNPDGSVLGEVYCNEPCKIISYPNGNQLAFNEGSIIGAAFADAIAGRLETASYSQPNRLGSSDLESRRPELPSWTNEERVAIADWMKANHDCRGGSDPRLVADACANRDDVYGPKLAMAGICYGRDNEAGSEFVMHRCEEDSLTWD